MLWGSAQKSLLRPLQIKQNKAIRCITGSPYNSSAPPLYKQTSVPRLDDMYKIELSKFMYLHYHKSLPLRLLSLFQSNDNTHNYNTRHCKDPHILRRKSHVHNSFIAKGPELWLSLPESTKLCPSIVSFKLKMKLGLISEYA